MINESINSAAAQLPAKNPGYTYAEIYNKAWNEAVIRYNRFIYGLAAALLINFVANIVKNYSGNEQVVYWAERIEQISWTTGFIVGLTLALLNFFNPVQTY